MRIDVEYLRNIGGGDRHELIGRQTTGANAACPEHRQPFFKPACAVRNLGEIANAMALLLSGKGTMIGRHNLQASGS
ncbi:hypothetical protein FQZ97_1039710 [compost metagenome]